MLYTFVWTSLSYFYLYLNFTHTFVIATSIWSLERFLFGSFRYGWWSPIPWSFFHCFSTISWRSCWEFFFILRESEWGLLEREWERDWESQELSRHLVYHRIRSLHSGSCRVSPLLSLSFFLSLGLCTLSLSLSLSLSLWVFFTIPLSISFCLNSDLLLLFLL